MIADRDDRVLGYRVLSRGEAIGLAPTRMHRALGLLRTPAARYVPEAHAQVLWVLRMAQHDYHDPDCRYRRPRK